MLKPLRTAQVLNPVVNSAVPMAGASTLTGRPAGGNPQLAPALMPTMPVAPPGEIAKARGNYSDQPAALGNPGAGPSGKTTPGAIGPGGIPLTVPTRVIGTSRTGQSGECGLIQWVWPGAHERRGEQRTGGIGQAIASLPPDMPPGGGGRGGGRNLGADRPGDPLGMGEGTAGLNGLPKKLLPAVAVARAMRPAAARY